MSLVKISCFFKDSIEDISWNSKGNALIAYSSDGTVNMILFDEHEIEILLYLKKNRAIV